MDSTLFQGSATAEMEVTKTTKSVTIDAGGATTTTVESTTTSGDGAAKAGRIFIAVLSQYPRNY